MPDHNFIAVLLLTFGGLFVIGLIADLVGRHSPFPRVTLLLLCGFAIGPNGFDWLPDYTETLFPILTTVALTMVGFLLGQRLVRKNFTGLGMSVICLSIGVVLITALLVFVALIAIGCSYDIALLLAGISMATAPAATFDTVKEVKAEGPFTNTLLGIVAIDDAWGLLIFSLILAHVDILHGNGGGVHLLQAVGWEIGGSFLLGIGLGIPLAFITGRIKDGESTEAEALGIVLLCAGLSIWLEVSYILSAIALGAVIANMIQHRCTLFRVVEHMEWPFLILFFLLAGASLHIDSLLSVGSFGAAYIVARIAGRYLGAQLGGALGHAPQPMRQWMGLALTPQAGVAIGMALLAGQRFPELRNTILPVVLGTTVFFELTGPVVTRWVLVRVGEAKQ